jgi:hypothetical protein
MSSKVPFYFLVILVSLAYLAHCKYQSRLEAGMLDVKEQNTKNLVVGFQSREMPLPENDLVILNSKDGPDAAILLGGVQVPQKPILFPTETTRIFPELDWSHRNRYPIQNTREL